MHFFRIDIQMYQHPSGNWKNEKLCKNTRPYGRRASTQFLVFPIATRVDITVYVYMNTENALHLHLIKSNLIAVYIPFFLNHAHIYCLC